MTLEEYKANEALFNQKSLELSNDPDKSFECGYVTGIAVLLSDIKTEAK